MRARGFPSVISPPLILQSERYWVVHTSAAARETVGAIVFDAVGVAVTAVSVGAAVTAFGLPARMRVRGNR